MARLKDLQNESERLVTSPIIGLESSLPLVTRLVVRIGVGSFVAFLIWSMLATVDEVARAQGEIVPRNKAQRIQHRVGGVVEIIRVADGDVVAAGDTLLCLRSDDVDADLARASGRHQLLKAERERLGLLALSSKGPLSLADLSMSELAEVEVRRHRHLLHTWAKQRGRLLDQVTYLRRRASALGDGQTRSDLQGELVRKELAIRDDWGEREIIIHSDLEHAVLRRELLRYEREAAESAADLQLANSQLSEMLNRLDDLDHRIIDQALADLVSVEAEIAGAQALTRRFEYQRESLVLRAGTEGIVQGSVVHAAGAVLRPGEVVMEIVPSDQPLVAEVRIRQEDIGHVRVGQSVVLKLTSYDYGRYGGLAGEVERLSPVSVASSQGEPHYRATVALSDERLPYGSGELPVLAGMTVQADIHTHSRSLLEYLLRPVFSSAREAFHER